MLPAPRGIFVYSPTLAPQSNTVILVTCDKRDVQIARAGRRRSKPHCFQRLALRFMDMLVIANQPLCRKLPLGQSVPGNMRSNRRHDTPRPTKLYRSLRMRNQSRPIGRYSAIVPLNFISLKRRQVRSFQLLRIDYRSILQIFWRFPFAESFEKIFSCKKEQQLCVHGKVPTR